MAPFACLVMLHNTNTEHLVTRAQRQRSSLDRRCQENNPDQTPTTRLPASPILIRTSSRQRTVPFFVSGAGKRVQNKSKSPPSDTKTIRTGRGAQRVRVRRVTPTGSSVSLYRLLLAPRYPTHAIRSFRRRAAKERKMPQDAARNAETSIAGSSKLMERVVKPQT